MQPAPHINYSAKRTHPPIHRAVASVNFANTLGKLHELLGEVDVTGTDESYSAFVVEAVECYYLPPTMRSLAFTELNYAMACFKFPTEMKEYCRNCVIAACIKDIKEQLYKRERRFAPNDIRPAVRGEGWFILEW